VTRPLRINKTELRRLIEVARETGMRIVIRPDRSIVLEEKPAGEGVAALGQGCDGGSPDREIVF
jgi:hypothetical protein